MVTLLLLKVVIHHTAIHHRLHSHLEPPQPPRRRELKVPALPPPARHKRGPRHLHTSLWSSTMPSTMSTKSRCMVYCLQCTCLLNSFMLSLPSLLLFSLSSPLFSFPLRASPHLFFFPIFIPLLPSSSLPPLSTSSPPPPPSSLPPLSTHRIVSSITQTFTRHSWRSYTLIKRNSEPSRRVELLVLYHSARRRYTHK